MRKAQSFLELMRTVAARKHSGFYYCYSEERAIAQYLVEHKGGRIDFKALQRRVPTRTVQSLKERLEGQHSVRIRTLIDEIEEEEERSSWLDPLGGRGKGGAAVEGEIETGLAGENGHTDV